MKLQVTTKELQRAFAAVSKVIRSKNSLPILDNVMFHEKDGRFFLTASDSENEITLGINMLLMEGKFSPFCINPKVILPALSSLADQPLNITVNYENNSYATSVEYLGGVFNVVSLPTTEFPRMAGVDGDDVISFSLDANLFLPCLRAASSNTTTDELRPVMQNVLFDLKDDGVVIVGTTGHILYKYAYLPGCPFGKGTGSVFINRAIVPAVEAGFRNSETIDIRSNGKFVSLTSGDVCLVMRSYDGRYPNYNSVIPASSPYHVTFEVKSMVAALKRVSLFASDSSNMVKFCIRDGKIELSAEDIDFSTSSKECLPTIDVNAPEDFAIGFKSSTLLQHLSTITTDNAVMLMTSPSHAALIRDDDPASGLTLLIMPMLLSD